MPCLDRENRLKNCKKWREENKDKLKEEYHQNKNGIKTRKELRNKKNILLYFEKKLQLKCERCEESHISCLEFHHLDRNAKEYNISAIIRSSLKKALEEMNKCIVLCSNCHRKEHWDDDKIEKLKNNIKMLEEKREEEKRYSICRGCGKNREEVNEYSREIKKIVSIIQKEDKKHGRVACPRCRENQFGHLPVG